MKRKLLEFLICPDCLPDEIPLSLTEGAHPSDDIIEGALRCAGCGRIYPIREGVAKIVPSGGRQDSASRYEEPALLSAYLWSHYADIFGDPEATSAYRQWAEEISCSSGTGLDAGCATGRFAFEMARKCDFVIGLDRSESFVSTARRILQARKLVFRVREEGRIQAERALVLPESWHSHNMEFIVGDAHVLPFRSGAFSCVASLNLIDKVPRPLEHVREMSRVARAADSQFLISDPFSWSEEICPPESWLGGVVEGEFSGRGLENLARILSGKPGGVSGNWKITRRGKVWWKIRNHCNHFELIRSLYIKAER